MASGWGGLNSIIEDALRRKEQEQAPPVQQQAQNVWKPPTLVLPQPALAEHQPQRKQQPQILQPRTANRPEYTPSPSQYQLLPDESYRPVPPLPDRMPAITPVADLKNRTVAEMHYTPEAAKLLYDTPTRVRYGDFATHTSDSEDIPLGSQGAGGSYWHPFTYDNRNYEIYLNGGLSNEQITPLLAHEFTHKWQDTQMPFPLWYEYGLNARDIAPDWAVEQASSPIYKLGVSPTELYAYSVMNGPWYIDDEARNHYYAGLFEGDQKQWDPPPTYLPLPPHIPSELGGSKWMPENWRVAPTSEILRERAPWTLENGLPG